MQSLGLAVSLLLLPSPALASDMAAIGYFLIAVLGGITLAVATAVYFATSRLKSRTTRQAIRALAISALIAPVTQSGVNTWGDHYSETSPMAIFLMAGGFYGDYAGLIIPPIIFFGVLLALFILVSRACEDKRELR